MHGSARQGSPNVVLNSCPRAASAGLAEKSRAVKAVANRNSPKSRACLAEKILIYLPLFFVRFSGPYLLCAVFSQAGRLPFAFLWQAFSAAVSFCARVSAFFFAQPVTLIFVDSLIFSPFWARNSVGIVSLLVQRFPLAASAEYLPWGRFSSKLEIGWSGT